MPRPLMPLLLLLLALASSAGSNALNDTAVAAEPAASLPALGGLRSMLRESAAGDCAQPTRTNVADLLRLAEAAEVVVSGVAVSAAPGSVACAAEGASTLESGDASAGPDLLPDYRSPQEGADTVLLLQVQCVHKGALACRRNAADSASQDPAVPPRCMIAVKIRQANETGQLPPCSLTRGFRYTVLLSDQAAAACDGAYEPAYPRITDAVHAFLGVPSCAPYPTWPSQDTSVNASGIAGLLARTCPGAAGGPAAPGTCSGADDPCAATPCDPQSGVVCVPKACEGKFMANSLISDAGACQPVFISTISGLPVASCDITEKRLARQARQADKRLGSGSVGGSRRRSSSVGGGSGGEPAAQPTRLGAVLPGASRLLPMPSLSTDAGGQRGQP